MRIVQTTIRNFRGVKSLEWNLSTGITCLIGPGDSGKSTILDAVELLFTPRWTVVFTDNDFTNCDPGEPLVLQATVVDPPADLLRDGKFLDYVRGFDESSMSIVDSITDETPALTIQLQVDATLEPSWEVVADRHEAGKPIRAGQREKFGVTRIGTNEYLHLRWARGSALTRLAANNVSAEGAQALVDASRAARNATSGAFTALDEVAKDVAAQAKSLRGLKTADLLSANLNADAIELGMGAIALHNGAVPVARSGLGSRRMTAVGAQMVEGSGIGILLVDELEAGLEPHRIRYFLRYLRSALANEESAVQQVLATTHSPIVLRELSADNINLVRRGSDAVLECRSVDPKFQNVIRANPEAFLAPRVVVCEGQTEVGITRAALDWSEANKENLQAVGVPASAGGESLLEQYAEAFRVLGYETSIFCDSDTKLDLTGVHPDIEIFRWPGNQSTEHAVLLNLDRPFLQAALAWVLQDGDKAALFDSVVARGANRSYLDRLATGQELTAEELGAVARPLADTAKANGKQWFKSVSGGETLGTSMMRSWPNFQKLDEAKVVRALLKWCFDL